MDDSSQDGSEVLETTETVEEPAQAATEEAQEDIEALKAKAARADELEEKNKQLFERAKKAEAKAKEDDISSADILYLAKADIHPDDIQEVRDWAKFKNVSVAEAHKQLKGVLAEKAEERKTAETTATGPVRRATPKLSDDAVIGQARRGNLPDVEDDAAISRLVEAELAQKLKR